MYKFIKILILLNFCIQLSLSAQNKDDKPKIVIGLVVDQMRQEYLFKYKDRYGEGGFKRLIGEGYMMKNAHLNYIPTYTGPGHASIYTGTTPSNHGIIANDWYLRDKNTSIYCVEDQSTSNISGSRINGYRSPQHLQTTTITDELKLSNNHKSKVISIALKDRAAILPAGHLGDAYWYDGATGEFMTSSYYKDVAPQWLLDFNSRELPEHYLNKVWETLYPIETYTQSIADNNEYEVGFKGKDTPEFPYVLASLRRENGNFSLLRSTPYGNTFTFDMVYAAIEGENLGNGKETDFLAVSITSTDVIGHNFGPTSVEVEDTYLRLDKDIEIFIDSLNVIFGNGEYLLFLTSDHGVADMVGYMKDQGIPVENISVHDIKAKIRAFTIEQYGKPFHYVNFFIGGLFIMIAISVSFYVFYKIKKTRFRLIGLTVVIIVFSLLIALFLRKSYDAYKGRTESWITGIKNQQIFLNRNLINARGLNFNQMRDEVAEYAKSIKGINEVYTSYQLYTENYINGNGLSLKKGFVEDLSGDIMLVLKPSWLPMHWKGTSHGSGYSYDTHIPIIFYGWNVEHGESEAYCTITDIAPTLSMMLNINFPSGTTGSPLMPILDNQKSKMP